MKSFDVQIGAERRTFSLRDNIPLSVRNWYDGLYESFLESDLNEKLKQAKQSVSDDSSTEYAALDYAYLLRHCLKNDELCVRGIKLGYVGNHSGIDWYSDVDAEIVQNAIGDLLLHFFTKWSEKIMQSLKSSQSIPNDSQTETFEGNTTGESAHGL